MDGLIRIDVLLPGGQVVLNSDPCGVTRPFKPMTVDRSVLIHAILSIPPVTNISIYKYYINKDKGIATNELL